MIIHGNRDREFVFRARHRTVNAHVYMQTPEFIETFPRRDFQAVTAVPSEEGSFVINRARIMSPDQFVVLSDDICEPEIEKSPTVKNAVHKKLQDRNMALLKGGLSSDEQRLLFDSSDLTDEATGLPKAFVVVFNDSSSVYHQIETVPFVALRSKLAHVQNALEKRDGRLQAVEVTHSCAVSAYDYNKIAQSFSHGGFAPSAGETMLRNADRLLDDVGITRVVRNGPIFH